MSSGQHAELSATLAMHPDNTKGPARGSRKRARLSGEEAAWTAARCNRILRTIDSRIAILQRSSTSNSTTKSKRFREQCARRSSACKSDVEAESEGDSPAAETPITKDPEWVPRARLGSKKTWKTYTAKHRHQSATHSGHGKRRKEPCFTTPFVKRVLQPTCGQDHMDGLDTRHLSTTLVDDHPVSKKSRQFPIKPASVADEAQRNLHAAFQSMLIQTQPKTEPCRTGAWSLMAICLRKVPSYIHLLDEEALECDSAADWEQGADDNSDTIYLELEGLGSAENGWPPLREIVRAHCVQRLCENIGTGVLPVHLVVDLIDACIVTRAVAEGQQIIKALFERHAISRSERKAEDVGERFCIAKLKNFALQTSSQEFEMRSVAHLLLDDSSGFVIENVQASSYWNPLVQAMLQPSSFEDGAYLFESLTLSVLNAMYGTEVKDQQHCATQGRMLYSSIVLVAAMTISVLMEETASPISRQLEELLQRIYLSVYTRINELKGAKKTWRASIILYALSMSVILIKSMQSSSPQHLVSVGLEKILNSLASTTGPPGKHEKSSGFVGDVARCISRFDRDSGSQMWKHTINSLLTLCDDVSAQQLHILQGLALESAEEYDTMHHHPGTTSFAAEVEATIRQYKTGTASRTPVSKSLAEGFRWDAGICEFVARTPFPILLDTSTDEEGSDLEGQDQCLTQTSSCEHRAEKAESRTASVAILPNMTKVRIASAFDSPRTYPQASTSQGVDHKLEKLRATRKRFMTEEHLDLEADKQETQLDCERDELGIPTPAVKKRRRRALKAIPFGPKPKPAVSRNGASRRETLGGHTTSPVALSDDELGV